MAFIPWASRAWTGLASAFVAILGLLWLVAPCESDGDMIQRQKPRQLTPLNRY
ncbi:hypothetical protein BDV11DRAFT_193711 [Aspergillus similis]